MAKGREGMNGEMKRWMYGWTMAWRMDGEMEGWSSLGAPIYLSLQILTLAEHLFDVSGSVDF